MSRPTIRPDGKAFTDAERQARRRQRYRKMQTALKAILAARTLAQARTLALEALELTMEEQE